MCDLTNPAFTDEDKARKFLEASRWPRAKRREGLIAGAGNEKSKGALLGEALELR